jgi:hypothetical protein
LPVPPALHLDAIPALAVGERAEKWILRLSDAGLATLMTAQDLYAGEHWMIARGLPNYGNQFQARLWVCSAGYGLIPADAQIRPYAAAFSGRSDRVPGGAAGGRKWWQALSEWEGPARGEPRSIESMVATDPSASFLLALSAPYLDVCRDDITAAIGKITDPGNFVVVSVGTRLPGNVGAAMVPADARLQAFLGGTRQALNARIAAHLLSAGISTRTEATDCMTRLLAQQPPITRYERKKLSDQEVAEMINQGLAVDPNASASKLLREFRDSGYACEQHRFANLYRIATGARR